MATLCLPQGVLPTCIHPWSPGPHSGLSEFSNTHPAPLAPWFSALMLTALRTNSSPVGLCSLVSSYTVRSLNFTSTPDTDQWSGQTTGVTPFWLQTEYLLWTPKEGIFLPSLCITSSYSSFGSRAETSLRQDRPSGSPGVGGTLHYFPTEFCFYLLWPWAPWTISMSHSPLYGLEFPRLHSSISMICWENGDWLVEWMNESSGCQVCEDLNTASWKALGEHQECNLKLRVPYSHDSENE